jgi:flagellar basal-body rod modification protein FlgD
MATVGATTTVASDSALQPAQDRTRLTSDQFLKLLITEVQNQNPLDPLKDTEFAAQLAQFSTVEGVDQLNSSFADLLLVQQLSQGASLIGKTVLYGPAGATSLKTGTIDAAQVQNGKLQLLIGGTLVPLDQVQAVEQAGSTGLGS